LKNLNLCLKDILQDFMTDIEHVDPQLAMELKFDCQQCSKEKDYNRIINDHDPL